MKIQVSRRRRQRSRSSDPCPYLVEIPPRPRRSRPSTGCYTGGPGRAIQPGLAGNRIHGCYPRASLRSARCRDRRRPVPPAAVTLAGGCSVCGPLVGPDRHVPAEAGARHWSTSPGLFTRSRWSPRRGTAVRSSGWRSRGANRRTAGSLTVTLRSDIRFHTGEPITAPVVRDLLGEEALPRLPEIAARRRARRSAPGSSDLQKPSSVKPEDLSTMLVDSDEPEGSGCAPAPSGSSPPSRWCSKRFDGYYQGKPSVERMEMHELPDASCGVDGHDAAGGEFPPRGQPRRHRVRRSRRRHPRLPAAAGPTTPRWSSACAIRCWSAARCGSPSTRRSIATSSFAMRMRGHGADCRRARSGPITGHIRRAVFRSRSTRRPRSSGSTAPGLTLSRTRARNRCRHASRSRA